MPDYARGKEEHPTDRLERWLVWKLEDGVLKKLPRYRPLREPVGECPDRYARTLLEGLRSAGGDTDVRERLRDDGRAFRSWAERALSTRRQSGNGPGQHITQGLAG
jgi:hypothetical protein